MVEIIGIDLGTKNTGFALLSFNPSSNKIKLKQHALLDLSKINIDSLEARKDEYTSDQYKKKLFRFKQNARLFAIYQNLCTYLDCNPIDVVIYEKPVMISNTGTYINEIIGVVNLAVAIRKLDIISYSPSEIKKAVAGFGDANKDDILLGLSNYLVHHLDLYSDHESDATAIALTYLINTYKIKKYNKTKVDVAVQEVIEELRKAAELANRPKPKF